MNGTAKTEKMSSRDKILAEIRQNRPPESPLPPEFFGIPPQDVNGRFREVLSSIGGKVLEMDMAAFNEHISSLTNSGSLANMLEAGEREKYSKFTAPQLEQIHTAVIRGTLGVSENGSVWVEEKNMGNRVLPFICQHLVLVVDAGSLVADMHEAYRKIRIDGDGYGVFIAGPSKTADIEQSLVIGAHGPLSLEVVLVQD
jgi:L-lactate dehydrogenase complex protein LldG